MQILIPDYVLWILFLILIGILIFFGIVFSYHWNHYGIHKNSKKVARVFYFFVSAILLATIAFFIGIYIS